jgi:arginyl-tRNA synthetase
MSSIFRRAGVESAESITADSGDLELLREPAEAELVKTLLRFPELVGTAAERRTPHLLCDYLEEVAGQVNSWYHAGNLNPGLRVVGVPPELSRARLVLARGVQIVLANGLSILGVDAPQRMERADAPA